MLCNTSAYIREPTERCVLERSQSTKKNAKGNDKFALSILYERGKMATDSNSSSIDPRTLTRFTTKVNFHRIFHMRIHFSFAGNLINWWVSQEVVDNSGWWCIHSIRKCVWIWWASCVPHCMRRLSTVDTRKKENNKLIRTPIPRYV